LPVKASTSRNIKKHCSPLYALFKHFNFNHRCLEKIPFKPQNPAYLGKLPFKTKILPNKAASVKEAMRASETVKVYSDGLANNGKVGVAAILTHPGKPHHILHYQLGSNSEHTVHEVELVGILLALQLIKSEKNGHTSFTISVDNQAALAAFKSDMRSLAHNIAREIL